MITGTDLGWVLLVAGLTLTLLVWLALRFLQRPSRAVPPQAVSSSAGADDADEGIVVIEPGGRVDFVNARARSWFEIASSDDPHLDRLLRRVRPPDDFLEICAQPGQKRLNLGGQPVEATSSRVPGSHPSMLVSIRKLELSGGNVDRGDGANSSLIRIITDFSGAVTASLDLESVLRSILDSTQRLVPADVLELKTWNQESRKLTTYRLVEANGRMSHAALVDQSQFGDLGNRVVVTRSPVLLADTAAILAESATPLSGLTSYLGIPLITGDELVGVLEAGQTGVGAFKPQEFDLLRLIAPQISTALRNSILYEQERRRTLEYSGLAGVAQAMGSIGEPAGLFARLVDAVAPLFDARIVGFLLLDRARGQLIGQVPFRGLPAHIVDIYRARVVPASPAEALIESRQLIRTDNAAEDENWRLLGLTDIALAASLRDSLLVPLATSARMYGYLQLSHREHPGPLPESDLRLLKIVADQLAAIIESAQLLGESRIRIARSEGLARLAEAMASAATVDDVLREGTKQLATLFSSDAAMACLLDELRGEISLHRPSTHVTPADWSGSCDSHRCG